MDYLLPPPPPPPERDEELELPEELPDEEPDELDRTDEEDDPLLYPDEPLLRTAEELLLPLLRTGEELPLL